MLGRERKGHILRGIRRGAELEGDMRYEDAGTGQERTDSERYNAEMGEIMTCGDAGMGEESIGP